jgi:hypothetical protein
VKIELDEASKERYNIVLSADLMHLMGMVFLVTVSRNYTFLTIKQVIGIYTGPKHVLKEIEFTEWNNPIHTLLVDNEFSALKDQIEEEGTRVNVAAKEEHVPEVEVER